MGRTFNLRILLVVVITALVLAATVSISLLHMTTFEGYAKSEAVRTLDGAARAIQSKIELLLKPSADIARYVLAHKAAIAGPASAPSRRAQFSKFLQSVDIVLRSNAHISSAYLGYSDGSFVIQTRNSRRIRKAANLPADITTRYLRLERDAIAERARDVWSYFQDNTWRHIKQPVSKYEPRDRPWYHVGRRNVKAIWSRLYRFYVDDGHGMTLVAGLRDSRNKLIAVAGVDVRLEDLTSFIRDLDISQNGFAFIARPNGELISHQNLNADTLSSSIDTGAPTLFEINRPDNRDLRLFEALSKTRAPSVQIEVDGNTILGRRLAVRGPTGFDGHLYVGAPLSDFTVTADQAAHKTWLIACVMILIVVVIGIWIARAISRPVRDAVRAMTAVSRLELQQAPAAKHTSLVEIAMLNASVETMQSALNSFVRYVPRDVVRDLLELRQPLELGGRRREVTVLFTDIENFTALAETDEHEQFIDGLADYFDIISSVIADHGGTVDKFIGDSVMAIWGAPREDAEHTQHACDAVVEIHRKLEELNQRRARSGQPLLTTRFGMHRGYTFVGNVGARNRFGYTALGDVVNIASRLEAANKNSGTRALVSGAVAASAGRKHKFKARGETLLRGKSTPIETFELVLPTSRSIAVELPATGPSYPIAVQ